MKSDRSGSRSSDVVSINRQAPPLSTGWSASVLAIAGFLQDMNGQRLLQLVIVCEFLLKREQGHCASASGRGDRTARRSRAKKKPRLAGALGLERGTSSFVDAPILSQGTNQAIA